MLKKYSDEDVFQIVKKVKKGSARAMGELAEIYGKFVFGTVYFEIKDKDAAEKLTEEIFSEAQLEIRFFTNEASFALWLYNIAKKQIKSLKHKHSAEPENKLSANKTDSADTALTLEGTSDVIKLINGLDAEIRLPVIYRDVMGLTYLEVADLTGVAAATAKKRVIQGRQTVKDSLEKM